MLKWTFLELPQLANCDCQTSAQQHTHIHRDSNDNCQWWKRLVSKIFSRSLKRVSSTTWDVLCSDFLRKHIFCTLASAASRLFAISADGNSQELLLHATTSVLSDDELKLFSSNFWITPAWGLREGVLGALTKTCLVENHWLFETVGVFAPFSIEAHQMRSLLIQRAWALVKWWSLRKAQWK